MLPNEKKALADVAAVLAATPGSYAAELARMWAMVVLSNVSLCPWVMRETFMELSVEIIWGYGPREFAGCEKWGDLNFVVASQIDLAEQIELYAEIINIKEDGYEVKNSFKVDCGLVKFVPED
jgi:hypothetical protein